MQNPTDATDIFLRQHGITTEDLLPPVAVFALALVDANGNVILDGLQTGARKGLGIRKTARATFDPSLNSGHQGIGTHGLGVSIPNGAIVIGGFAQVVTAVDSSDHSGTLAITLQSANDIISAAAISGAPWSTAGVKAIIPKNNTPESTGIILTAAREISAVVATTALTAGKVRVFLDYVNG